MTNLNIKKTLGRYGLNEEEIKVYLSTLSLGSATVREISKNTKINRTTLYRVADKLVDQGVLGKYHAKYGSHYTASSPQNLITRLDDIRMETEKIIPQLEAMEKKELYEPKTNFYRGKEGYLTVLNDSLEGFSYEILYLASAKDLNEIVSEDYITNRYIATRLKRNLTVRQLVFPDKFSQYLKSQDSKELRVTKYLPENYNFTANMLIFRDKVAYFTSKRELISVLIESKEIVEMEKQKFELIWNSLS